MNTGKHEPQPSPEALSEAAVFLLGCELLHQVAGVHIPAAHEEEIARTLGVELARAKEQAARLQAAMAVHGRNSMELLPWMRLEAKLLRYLVEHQNSAGEFSLDVEELLAMVRP